MFFNDRRANKRALKAANKGSLAPKNYKPDTESRDWVESKVYKGRHIGIPSRKHAAYELDLSQAKGKSVIAGDEQKVPSVPKNKQTLGKITGRKVK